jgi:hypothetical protein
MQLAQWSNGIGKYMLKVEDGKSVIGNFRGEVVRFWQHWKDNRGSVCPGRETCEMCASENPDDRKATGRFRVNFIVKGSPMTSMVFEGGKRVYDQLLQLNKDIPLEKAWVRISRTGTKQSTQYMLSIIPGESGMVKINEENEILALELHDLALNKEEDDVESEAG